VEFGFTFLVYLSVCERWIIEAYFVGGDENIEVIPPFLPS
jgi:hypothetical protein